jgi:hypothetical protein
MTKMILDLMKYRKSQGWPDKFNTEENAKEASIKLLAQIEKKLHVCYDCYICREPDGGVVIDHPECSDPKCTCRCHDGH